MNKKSSGIFCWVWYWCVIWGISQLFAEARKIVVGDAQEKFPFGWKSFNPLEEWVEGALPVLLVCSLYVLIFRWWKKSDPTPFMIGVWSLIAYMGMVFLGGVIHDLCGVTDTKLLEVLLTCRPF